MNKTRSFQRFVSLACTAPILAATHFAYAQVPIPVVGCINTSGSISPFIQSGQGVAGTPPVILDFGVATPLILGTDDDESGGFGLIDGTFNARATDGCSVTAGALVMGQGLRSSGQMTVGGPTVFLRVNGPFNRLDIGLNGAGDLSVREGGYVDMSSFPEFCFPDFCNAFVSNIAGSRGKLTIDGAGSRVDTLNRLVIGQANVFEERFRNRTSRGELYISNGGQLNSENAVVSAGAFGAFFVGRSSSIGIADIRGANSEWNVSGVLAIAEGENSNGTLTVAEGAQVSVGVSLDIFPGGTLNGAASVIGDIFNVGGVVNLGLSPGQLTVTGNFTQFDGSTIFEVQGPSRDAMDFLSVSNMIQFAGGRLILEFSNGFGLAAGEAIQFLSAPVIDIDESLVEIRGLLPGFAFSLDPTGQLIALSDGVPSMVEPNVDVRPGDDEDQIDLNSNQLFSLAILTSSSDPIFDAVQLDPSTIRFGPGSAKPVPKKTKLKDVDKDGRVDLRVWFRAAETGLACGATSAELTAMTYSGTSVQATAEISATCD